MPALQAADRDVKMAVVESFIVLLPKFDVVMSNLTQ